MRRVEKFWASYKLIAGSARGGEKNLVVLPFDIRWSVRIGSPKTQTERAIMYSIDEIDGGFAVMWKGKRVDCPLCATLAEARQEVRELKQADADLASDERSERYATSHLYDR